MNRGPTIRPLPVVLSGGRSVRFGRDKLREPTGAGDLLIDRPIAALREVFGAPIALAGACDPAVAARAELVIPDRLPGCGPVGGIVAALEHPLAVHGVFVLAGDLPAISSAEVRAIWEVAEAAPEAWAVLAETDRLEPCVGVYRAGVLPVLIERMGTGRRSLYDAVPEDRLRRVPVAREGLRNVNEPGDMR